MEERDWIEKIFLKTLKTTYPKIDFTKDNVNKINNLMINEIPNVVDILDDFNKKKSKKYLKIKQKESSLFKKNILKRWISALDELEFFIIYNQEYAARVASSYRLKNNQNIKFETLLRLNARACQISFEVLELLKSGFADGAIARWRTLYEVSVISNFLSNNPEELCQQYLDYYHIENYSELIEYTNNCFKLGYEPFTKEDISVAEKVINDLKQKYGNDFSKNYGWLTGFLPKEKRNFAGIEETIDFKEYRSFYKMANNYVHSGSKGFLYKLGTIEQNEILLAGPSNYGLADPGINTAFSFLQTTKTLTYFESYLEDSVFYQLAMKLYESLRIEFVTIQKEIEKEVKEKKILRKARENTN